MLHFVVSDQGLHCLPITHLGVSLLKWVNTLTLSLLGKDFSRQHFDDTFLIFPRKQAYLAAHSTGDQEVAGLTPRDHGDLIMKYFLWSFPSADSRRAVVSFRRKNAHNTGEPLRGLSLPSKRVVR